MSKQATIERISRQSTSNVGIFMQNFIRLIQLFRNHIDSAAFEDVNGKLNTARRVLQCDRELVDYVYGYFLRFEKEISENNDRAMLEFDYTTLIVPNCEQNTKELILTLIDNIKTAYSKGNEELNSKIRNTVKALAKHARIHQDLKDLMTKFN